VAGRSSSDRTTAPAPAKAPGRRLRRVALQLDDEVVQHFKKLAAEAGTGERYTALINQILLEHVQAANGGRSDVTVTQVARMLRVELERLAAFDQDAWAADGATH
jgi:hypothetical protein